MQDVRTTDKLSSTSVYNVVMIPSQYPLATGPTQWTLPRQGVYKQIVSERDGKFVPGTYRTNPVTIKSAVCSTVRGEYHSRLNGYGWVSHYGDLACALWDSSLYADFKLYAEWSDRLASYSRNKAEAKLKDADADVALMLAELRETLDMLRSPFKALTQSWTKMIKQARKKSSVDTGVPMMDALSGGWLTYRYGILPLISDINSLIALFNKKLVQSVGMGRRKAGISETYSKTYDKQIVGGGGTDFTDRLIVTTESKSTSHLYYQQLLEAGEVFKMRVLGFHWTNVPALLWETTTLSFVVDWAIAVGDWLRAITPNTNLSMLGNCTSQKHTVVAKAETMNPHKGVGTLEIAPIAHGYWTWESSVLIRRVELAAPVLPAFTFDVLNWKRTLDSISLLWQPVSQQLRRAKYASKR